MKKITKLKALAFVCLFLGITVSIFSQQLVGNQSRLTQHPRLMFNSEKITQITKQLPNSPALERSYEDIIKSADKYVGAEPTKYYVDTNDVEQLWQRNVGNTMPYLGMAYQLTHNKKYLVSAVAWAKMAMSYPIYGEHGQDLSAGHILFGLATVYDWCYDGLTPEFRKEMEMTMIERCLPMYNHMLNEKGFWSESFLQNHLWINSNAVLAVASVLIDKRPDLQPWIEMAKSKMQRTMELLGPDGASHEGVAYWSYGLEYLLRYNDIVRDLYGIDNYKGQWFHNTSKYYLSFALPQTAWRFWEEIIDNEDCPRRTWYGPSHLLRKLASEYNDEYAQQRAEELETSTIKNSNSWLALLWTNPDIKKKNIESFPLVNNFKDMGFVTSRTGWGENVSLLMFKSGPPLGHEATKYHSDFSHSSGHVQPDAGTFCLYGNNRFLIRNPGYSQKITAYQNTMLVDGRGQAGEGGPWYVFNAKESPELADSKATMTVIQSSPDMDYFMGDATTAYDSKTELRSYRRHIVYLKSISALVILDEVLLNRPKEVTFNFHPEVPAKLIAETRIVESHDSLATLWLQPLLPEAIVHTSVEDALGQARRPFKLPNISVSYHGKTSVWNPVILNWAKGNAGMKCIKTKLIHKSGSDSWTFELSGHGILTLNPVKLVADWKTTK